MTRDTFFRCRYWIIASALFVIILSALLVYFLRRGRVAFPYQDSFQSNKAAEWTPLGGAWQIDNGAVYNRSDEGGAKLVSGSPNWTDYQLGAELKLIGHEGDVGVIVRSGDEERGVDSYKGYYVGLRSADSALVIGRADHGWMEGQPVPMKGGVQIGVWYRLRVVVLGCRIGAEAINIKTGQTSWGAFSDEPCIAGGRIGLRSKATGGAWRNVSVTATSESAWREIRLRSQFLEQPNYPGRESDYSRMRERYFQNTYLPVRSYQPDNTAQFIGGSEHSTTKQISPIEDVRATPLNNEPVTVRGVVTLTAPMFVQDQTGSIAVQLSKTMDLNLGDEVEISGKRVDSGFTRQLVPDQVRLLWDRTEVVPISITSTEAASGVFDASLVELRGKLRSKSFDHMGNITLQLYDSAQTFSATVRGGLSMQTYEKWEPGSDLSIRGICTILPPADRTDVAFTVLMRAVDDVQVLAGPPWWNGRQLIRVACVSMAMLACGIYLFIRLERWKMHAIINERERLAHDMHDTLAQSFAGVGFHLQGLCNSMRIGTADRSDVIEMLHRAYEMVSHSHREASACIAALHPDADEGGDFLLALDRCAREMLDDVRRDSKVFPVRFVREGTARSLSMPVRDALFHIGREAITNMLRHSHATDMELELRYQAEGVVLNMRDNGIGFVYDPAVTGFGLRTMQRRCAKVRAQISITSAPGLGTQITVHVPYGFGPRSIDWVRSLQTRMPHRA